MSSFLLIHHPRLKILVPLTTVPRLVTEYLTRVVIVDGTVQETDANPKFQYASPTVDNILEQTTAV